MKPIKFLVLFILVINIFACEPPVTFSEPQPSNTNDLTQFPKRIQGNYLSLLDNSHFIIYPNQMVRTYSYYYKIHASEIDSSQQIVGDSIINKDTNEKSFVKIDGDSLAIHTSNTDTLFYINATNILRKYKGYYFINTLYDSGAWEVKKIELSKGKLYVSTISNIEDIAQLKLITESKMDTLPYKFTVSKSQFKNFVKNDGFSDTEVFARVE